MNNLKLKKYNIFVFANLKPSQIFYKILPLSRSNLVENVYILRKKPLEINEDKITCISLPWIFQKAPFYWIFTVFFGVFYIKKLKTNLIINYNILPHGINAYIASKLSKQKTIFAEINEDTIKYYNKILPRYIINKILNNASFICTPGKNIESFWNNVGFYNTIRLHSTIDIQNFKPDFSIEKVYDFIYIGELDQNKRPDFIIDAFFQVLLKFKDLKLCIIGYGILENDIKKQIEMYNIQKNVYLFKTNDVLCYIQKSKTLLMASLSEGLPCAMMEAMSCELNVIVPDVGDISEVVIHMFNGLLYDNTFNKLVYYMEESILNYSNWANLRSSARKTIVDEHSYEIAELKWNFLLDKL